MFRNDISYGNYEVTGRPEQSWATIGERFILADKLADGVMKSARLEEGMYRRVGDVSGEVLAGLQLAHPLCRV